jgi:carbon storage regulator
MLVFSRKKDEAIVIGSEIELKIISIGRDTVKVGIDAPRHITIHRKEIYLAIEEENRRAAAAAASAQKFNPGKLGLFKDLVNKQNKSKK